MNTTVLGGGLSGLAAGYYLLRRFGHPMTIYEASHRIGGWIRTERHRDRGFMFELGPHTIRPKGESGANTLELINDLKLSLKPIATNHIAARNRLIYAKGQLCLLPNSFMGMLKRLPPFSAPLYRAIFQDLRTETVKRKAGDESIYSFVKRRFGDDIADYAISPIICGICAGDAKEISVRFLMNGIFEKEQKWGGVIKGVIKDRLFGKHTENSSSLIIQNQPDLYKQAQNEKWAMYGVEDGLEQLPLKLGAYLRDRNVNIKTKNECSELRFHRDGVCMVIGGEEEVEVEHILSSLPAYKLGHCVKNQHPNLAAQLLSIPYVDVAVINLQYNSDDLLKTNGFGFLVPPKEKLPILGVIFDSCCFEMSGSTVLTVMMGGKWFGEYFGQNPTQKELLDIALKQIKHILGIEQQPKYARVNILHKCIPQYTVGHNQRVADIRRYLIKYKLPLSVCGAAFDGVGINDVILSARNQVNALPVVS